MANFTFYPANRQKEKTTLVLYCRWDNLTLKLFTGISVQTKYWNQDKNALKQTDFYPEGQTLNQTLKELRAETEEKFNDLRRVLKRNPTFSEFEAAIKGQREGEKPSEAKPDFVAFFRQQIEKRGIELDMRGKSKSSLLPMRAALKTVIEFKGSERIEFSEIDEQFYIDFVNYCTKTKEFKPNTLGLKLLLIRSMMHRSINKYHNNYAYKNFKVPKEDVYDIYLTDTELEKIKNLPLDYKNGYLYDIRNIFYIASKTGLRVSDWTQLQKIDLTGDYFQIETIKTTSKTVLPISKGVKEILKAYNYKLPKLPCHTTINKHIREICRLAEINSKVEITYTKGGKKVTEVLEKWELASTHTARRSFATNLYLKGASMVDLMRLTTHTTEYMLLKYIKVTNSDAATRLKDLLD